MSMQYIRNTYGIPVKRGMRVRIKLGEQWRDGFITRATHYVFVKPAQYSLRRFKFHPTDSDFIQYPEIAEGRE